MVEGFLFFTWDSQVGPVLEYNYPASFQLSEEIITKIYMAQSIDAENQEKSGFIEMKMDDVVYWSYCDFTTLVDRGYEIVVLTFNEHEKIPVTKVKTRFINIARLLFKHDKPEQVPFLESSIDLLFEQRIEQKILLLGRAGTGKSSIKKVIFEGKNPYKLLYSPLEPTLDLEPSVYSWLDVSLGLFDSSGQELQNILGESAAQDLAFENVAVVIYIIDVASWINDNAELKADIETIKQILETKHDASKLVIFLNKIDLIAADQRVAMLAAIKLDIEESYGCTVYLTSIFPDLIYQTYNAFSEIMSYFSLVAKNLKAFLDEKCGKFTKTASFILNYNKTIIAQSIAPDFDLTLINPANEIMAQLLYSFESLQEGDMIDYVSIASEKGTRLFLKHMDFVEFEVSDLVIVTSTISGETFSTLSRNLRDALFDHFYNRSSQ